jgi:hypothetical protein
MMQQNHDTRRRDFNENSMLALRHRGCQRHRPAAIAPHVLLAVNYVQQHAEQAAGA